MKHLERRRRVMRIVAWLMLAPTLIGLALLSVGVLVWLIGRLLELLSG